MGSFLQRRIKNYLDATGLSVSALERKAGLKLNVARNILRGQSKKPTAETLQAIANVMGCTVSDLLGVKMETFKSDIRPPSDGTPLLEAPEVLDEALHAILEVIKNNNYKMTVRQTLLILEEVYSYTLKKTPPKIDKDFVEWFVKRTIN
ncbi:MAG: helix-turn-helix domain-containing protein [Thermodesulfobium sp.]